MFVVLRKKNRRNTRLSEFRSVHALFRESLNRWEFVLFETAHGTLHFVGECTMVADTAIWRMRRRPMDEINLLS